MELFGIHFLNEKYLYLSIGVVILLFFLAKDNKDRSFDSKNFTTIRKIFGKNSILLYFKILLIFVIYFIFILLLANPHKAHTEQTITKNGIDIVLALDISKSMEATDLQPSRLEKAKLTITDFIEVQTTNRVGLIVFAGKPVSSVPLTFDYNILTETLHALSTDSLNQYVSGLDGTAVGDALLMSKNLFNSDDTEREKVVILLTDGDANRGVEPILASKLLAGEDIKIYTIGIGSTEGGTMEVTNGFFKQQVQLPPLNTKNLKEIASLSGGFFFRVSDGDSLEKVFHKLESLEKNDIEVEVHKSFSSYYSPFVYILICLVGLLIILEFRRVKT